MDVSTSHGRLSKTARAFIARRHKLLIDGKWVEAKSGKTFAVFDPSNGQQIAQVAEGGAPDIAAAGKLVWKLGDVLEQTKAVAAPL